MNYCDANDFGSYLEAPVQDKYVLIKIYFCDDLNVICIEIFVCRVNIV